MHTALWTISDKRLETIKTYLNLTSLHRASMTVAPPNEWPITAILHRSMEFCYQEHERELRNQHKLKLYSTAFHIFPDHRLKSADVLYAKQHFMNFGLCS